MLKTEQEHLFVDLYYKTNKFNKASGFFSQYNSMKHRIYKTTSKMR